MGYIFLFTRCSWQDQLIIINVLLIFSIIDHEVIMLTVIIIIIFILRIIIIIVSFSDSTWMFIIRFSLVRF